MKLTFGKIRQSLQSRGEIDERWIDGQEEKQMKDG
jgi:hypothetical protein